MCLSIHIIYWWLYIHIIFNIYVYICCVCDSTCDVIGYVYNILYVCIYIWYIDVFKYSCNILICLYFRIIYYMYVYIYVAFATYDKYIPGVFSFELTYADVCRLPLRRMRSTCQASSLLNQISIICIYIYVIYIHSIHTYMYI